MRKVLVVEVLDSDAQSLADKYGIGEVAVNVPRYAGIVTFYPAIVVESATYPGQVLGVFNPDGFSPDDLNALQDLPAPDVQLPDLSQLQTKITDIQSQIEGISVQLNTIDASNKLNDLAGKSSIGGQNVLISDSQTIPEA